MTAPAMAPPNPFIGPRPYKNPNEKEDPQDKEDPPLYGRDAELRRLRDLLIADRIVLFYAPSGAGKTSLIQRRLLPEFSKSFHIFPVVRFGAEPPSGHQPQGPPYNYYVWRTLRCWESDRELAAADRLPPDRLARLELAAYLDERETRIAARPPIAEGDGPGQNDKPPRRLRLLVFDQFEEVLALDPTDLAAKAAFFRQIGDVVLDQTIWVLFCLREDYVAGLDPYLLSLPTRIESSFRMDLLGADAAQDAIEMTAATSDVVFHTDAAQTLLGDLRRINVMQADGSVNPKEGPFVEPVLLQVVCNRLWDRIPWQDRPAGEGHREINPADVQRRNGSQELAQVDAALVEYYGEHVRQIAESSGVPERDIREWIDTNLITDRLTRTPVRLGSERGLALTGGVIHKLRDAYLIRPEPRLGEEWFELTHDRLVFPVKRSNRRWFAEHLHPFQIRAANYYAGGSPPDLLLRGAALGTAKRWADENAEKVRNIELDFLNASLREQRRANSVRVARIAFLVLGVLVIAALGWGLISSNRQRAMAVNRFGDRLAAQAFDLMEEGDQVDLALLLALEADRILADGGVVADAFSGFGLIDDPNTSIVRGSLLAGLLADPGLVTYLDCHVGAVTALAFDPDPARSRLASGGDDGQVVLWDLSQPIPPCGDPEAMILPRAQGADRSACAEPDELAAAERAEQADAAVTALAFAPDGAVLAVGDAGGALWWWNLGASPIGPPTCLGTHGGAVTALAFASTEKATILATGGEDGTVSLWDTAQPMTELVRLNPGIVALAAPPLLPVPGGPAISRPNILRPAWPLLRRPVRSLAFSADGLTLAAGADDGKITLWTGPWDTLADRPCALSAGATSGAGPTHTRCVVFAGIPGIPGSPAITAITFGPTEACDPTDQTFMYSGDDDGAIQRWDTATRQVTPTRFTDRHDGRVSRLVLDPTNPTRLISIGSDGAVSVWDTCDPERNPAALVETMRAAATSMAMDAAGRALAIGNEDGKILLLTQPVGPAPLGHRVNDETLAEAGGVSAIVVSTEGDRTRLITVSDDGVVGTVEPDLADSGGGSGIGPLEAVPTAGATGTATSGIFDVGALVQQAQTELTTTDWVLSPDGERIAMGNADGTVIVLDPRDGEQDLACPGAGVGVTSLAFAPNGQALAAGHADGSVTVWHLSGSGCDPEPLGAPPDSSAVRSLVFDPGAEGATRLVTAHDDGAVRLWGSSEAALLGALDVPGTRMTTLAFGPDGRQLAGGGEDGAVYLWEDPSPGGDYVALESDLEAPLQVRSLVFSPVRWLLAVGYDDGTIGLFSLADQRYLGRLVAHDGVVTALAFGRDGAVLASGDDQGVVIRWEFDIEIWRVAACERAGRGLAHDEWTTYIEDDLDGYDERRCGYQAT